MKKIIFLLIFLSPILVIMAQEDTATKQYLTPRYKRVFGERLTPKKFVKNNCELAMNWYSRGFNFQLTYTEKFPLKLADYLNNKNSDKASPALSVIFLDKNGFELLRGKCYFKDFTFPNNGDRKEAIFKDHMGCDSHIYGRISSVVIDFGQ